eukprot:TRINITY_DN12480_c0_g1_i1.p1 TRINITY_DN12480_c0_g1~~TRINITY_DN12480_c0_g1_i1.p1  ORF type:complete len:306 (+),score=44.12 TRINITY_DN12480_c0_g1_i1:35-919(+)
MDALEQKQLLEALGTSKDQGLPRSTRHARRVAEGPNVIPRRWEPPAWLCCLLPCLKASKLDMLLEDLIPEVAQVLYDGRWVQMDAAGIQRGDIVTIQAGDRAPADVCVLDEYAPLALDASAVAGARCASSSRRARRRRSRAPCSAARGRHDFAYAALPPCCSARRSASRSCNCGYRPRAAEFDRRLCGTARRIAQPHRRRQQRAAFCRQHSLRRRGDGGGGGVRAGMMRTAHVGGPEQRAKGLSGVRGALGGAGLAFATPAAILARPFSFSVDSGSSVALLVHAQHRRRAVLQP